MRRLGSSSWAKIIVSNIAWQAARAWHVGVGELHRVILGRRSTTIWQRDVPAIPSQEEQPVRHIVLTSHGRRTYFRVLIKKDIESNTTMECSQNCIERLRVGTFDSDVSYELGTKEPLPTRA